MKLHTSRKLTLNRETLRNLSVKTSIKAGGPTADCSQNPQAC